MTCPITNDGVSSRLPGIGVAMVQCRAVNALPVRRLSVSSPSRPVKRMITVYLRVYRPHNYRNKQNYRDHGANGGSRADASRHTAQREPCITLNLRHRATVGMSFSSVEDVSPDFQARFNFRDIPLEPRDGVDLLQVGGEGRHHVLDYLIGCFGR